jgi:penicillin-binding protein 2
MISGLFDVYNLGTASALRVDGITIVENWYCRKLCQNYGIKWNHSIFVAFAPMENPKLPTCND